MKVWVVNCGDTGCDEPGYIAFAMVFANREEAQKVMEGNVREDCDSYEVEAVWDDEREMAIIELDGGRQIVYTLNEEEVR